MTVANLGKYLIRASLVLEKEPRVLHLDQPATKRESDWTLPELLKPQIPPPVTLFFQQGLTSQWCHLLGTKQTVSRDCSHSNHHRDYFHNI